jgi:ribonuclease P protein component
MTVSFNFRKEERLSGKKVIAGLFDSGQAFSLYPFRVFWKIEDTGSCSPARIAVSVSKRYFKKAVDRNRIKRLTREAWRLNKHVLYKHLEENNINLVLMLVYTREDMPEYDLIEQKVKNVVSKLLLILPIN